MPSIKYTPKSRRRGKSNIGRIAISITIIVAVFFVIKWIWAEDEAPTSPPEPSIIQPQVKKDEPQKRQITTSTKTPRAVTRIKPVTDVAREPLRPASQQETTNQSSLAKPTTNTTVAQPQAVKTSAPLTQEDQRRIGVAKKLVLDATNDIKNGKIIAARIKLNEALRLPLESSQRDAIKAKLTQLSDVWLFSDKVLPDDNLCSYYKVQSGDLMSTIGKKHNIPWELLLKLNDIGRPENLRAGARIKVVNGPFNAIIYKDTFTMDLYLQRTYVKSYRVGLGMIGKATPSGMWLVKNDKLITPNWTDQETGKVFDATDPDYPLGKRWIGLKGLSGNAKGKSGFALHGTKEPDSIGTRCSRGCVRLLNTEILEVYDLMTPNQSQVQIKESRSL